MDTQRPVGDPDVERLISRFSSAVATLKFQTALWTKGPSPEVP
jgi:hypothetical protein